jgi:hypothetical protein
LIVLVELLNILPAVLGTTEDAAPKCALSEMARSEMTRLA